VITLVILYDLLLVTGRDQL